jgi:predicted RNase H-like nuclease (RuvC/YqgF family)
MNREIKKIGKQKAELEAKVKEKDTEITKLHAQLEESKAMVVPDDAVEFLRKKHEDEIKAKDKKIDEQKRSYDILMKHHEKECE